MTSSDAGDAGRPAPSGLAELAHEIAGEVRLRRAGRDGIAGLADDVAVVAASRGSVLGAEDLSDLTHLVRDGLWGLGPLTPLLRDPEVSDVLVNGAQGVYVERAGRLCAAPVVIGGEGEVRALAVRLASAAGRRLDDAAPWVDARLPGGLRLHAVLPAVSPGGTHLSIRRIRGGHLSLDELVSRGAVPDAWRAVLRALLVSRLSFLISGGTGAGKTTVLGALLGLVPPDERLLLVEDVAELAPVHPHVVRLEGRPPNVEGTGEVTTRDLVRQALRMRPDRIVVGECRGAEVRDLLAALNTGHAGGGGTVHANAATEVPARIEALGALAGLTAEAVRVQFAAAVDVVLHVERRRDRRVLAELGLVRGDRGGRVEVVPALVHTDRGSLAGPGWPELRQRLGIDPARTDPARIDRHRIDPARTDPARTERLRGEAFRAPGDPGPEAGP